MQKVIQFITCEWSAQAIPYPCGQYRDELSLLDGILFKGSRIVISSVLQKKPSRDGKVKIMCRSNVILAQGEC